MQLNQATFRALDVLFKEAIALRQAEVPTWHLSWFQDIPVSGSKAFAMSFIAALSQVTEWITDRTKQNLKRQLIQRVLRSWEDSVEVDKDDIVYDRLGQVKPAIAGIADDKPLHQIELLLDLIHNGHGAGAWYQGYDLVPFFSASHPIDTQYVASGLQQNYWSDLDLTAANINTVDAAMRALKGENGKQLGITPDELYYTPDLYGTAADLILKNPLAGGEGNILFKKYELQKLEQSDETNIWGLRDSTKAAKVCGWAHAAETVLRWLQLPGEMHKQGLYGNDYDAELIPIWWQLVSKCVHTP